LSGKRYVPNDRERVGEHNLVTVDISPARDGIWGDCARTFCVEDGRHTVEPCDTEFRAGVRMIRHLHEWVRRSARPLMTCDHLFASVNQLITGLGFENLDFAQNVGHTICRELEERSFINHTNRRPLADMGLFTFEPHIRRHGGRWGIKHENIYFFGDDCSLVEL
jgi:Xaa-Pro aminopeptidase